MRDIIYQLRIWLAYFIMPKGTRKHLLKALSYKIKELASDTEELLKRMNVEAQGDDRGNG
jgi:hypothetical protein